MTANPTSTATQRRVAADLVRFALITATLATGCVFQGILAVPASDPEPHRTTATAAAASEPEDDQDDPEADDGPQLEQIPMVAAPEPQALDI
jgi:hypothetical protein